MMGDTTNSFEEHHEFVDTNGFSAPASPDDLFSIFESLDAELVQWDADHQAGLLSGSAAGAQRSSSLAGESETEGEAAAAGSKRSRAAMESSDVEKDYGLQKMSHITVERNRRKQMNEHLSVLRSLMPCFYVKRGDQASIIAGVVDYINELQQILQSLEAKKRRKVYTETVLSPGRPVLSPRPSPLSPRSKPPLSPRLNLPISPRTPQPASPYRPRLIHQQAHGSSGNYGSALSSPSPTSSSSSSVNENILNELAANSKSSIADVEVKFSGANLLLKTVSPRIPGQVTKIISVLEELALEILQANINSSDETMVNSFTIKIGIECQLSAEDLAHQIQQTFHQPTSLYFDTSSQCVIDHFLT